MVAEVDTREHDNVSECPRQADGDVSHILRGELKLEGGEECQVDGKEYHELGVARRPADESHISRVLHVNGRGSRTNCLMICVHKLEFQ